MESHHSLPIKTRDSAVGVADFAVDRRSSARLLETSICASARELCVRSRLAESEACLAGLGSPPTKRSRFWDFPIPTTPAVLRLTDKVFDFSSLLAVWDSGEREGCSSATGDTAVGAWAVARLGVIRVEASVEIVGGVGRLSRRWVVLAT